MSTDIEPYVNDQGEVILAGPVAARVAKLLAAVPVDDENGNARIAEQLLSGGTVTDLNRPWDATSGRDLVGKVIRIDSVRRLPSRFGAGLREFLIVEGEDVQRGEPVVMTTSALAVVIQLARVCAEGWLPAWAEVVQSAEPTASGYRPYHLQFVPPQPDGRR